MQSRFGERLKILRLEKNMTQEQIGKLINKGDSTVRMWELNKNQPSHDIVLALADYFDVSTDYLLGNSDIKKGPSTKEELLKKNPDLEKFVPLVSQIPDEAIPRVIKLLENFTPETIKEFEDFLKFKEYHHQQDKTKE